MTHPTPGLEQGLTILLERVKAATGPDREIECDLAAMFYSRREGEIHRDHFLAMHCYTSSIDAALALVERCGFPLGAGRWNYTMAAAYGSFSIIPNDPHSTGIHDKRCGHAHGAPTIPLAILVALLSALSRANGEQP